MANEIKGERAQCPCQREGWIVDESPVLDVQSPWWLIAHEGDVTHRVTRHWTGTKFNLVLEVVT